MLVMTGSEGKWLSNPDKFCKFLCMEGYSMQQWEDDLKWELIDLKYPRVLLFVGRYEVARKPVEEIRDRMSRIISGILRANPKADLYVQAVLPWPGIQPVVRQQLGETNRAIIRAVKQRSVTKPNIFYLTGAPAIYRNGHIRPDLFQGDGMLSVKGATFLRRYWLQELGYLPTMQD